MFMYLATLSVSLKSGFHLIKMSHSLFDQEST